MMELLAGAYKTNGPYTYALLSRVWSGYAWAVNRIVLEASPWRA